MNQSLLRSFRKSFGKFFRSSIIMFMRKTWGKGALLLASNIDQTDTFDSPKRGLESRTKYLLWCLDRIQQIAYHSARSRLLYFLASKLNKDESLMKNLICILFFSRFSKRLWKRALTSAQPILGWQKRDKGWFVLVKVYQ